VKIGWRIELLLMCKLFGGVGYRGESLIEMGNSRFRVRLLVGRRSWRWIVL